MKIVLLGCSSLFPLTSVLKKTVVGAQVLEAPFGQVAASVLGGDGALWDPAPEVAIVWQRAEAAFPSLRRLVEGELSALGEIQGRFDDELSEFHQVLAAAEKRVGGLLLVAGFTLPRGASLGLLEWKHPGGLAAMIARANASLFEAAARLKKLVPIDLAAATRGLERLHDDRMWYLGKIPFAQGVYEKFGAEAARRIRALSTPPRKVIVTDLDNTLWGGIVGEVGPLKVSVGGTDPKGEAFRDYQRALRALSRRGILLAIASKNDEGVAMEALSTHPEMLLRPTDFAAWRINWRDKAQNIAELADELSLGRDSFVFIDDTPAERALVRETFPEILVPEWPKDPAAYMNALLELECFDTLRITSEDLARSGQYVAERGRQSMQREVSYEEWLQRLGLEVKVEAVGAAQLPRVAQLFAKTNQFNMTTRRRSEAELEALGRSEDARVLAFSAKDRFGDQGLIGAAVVSRTPGGDTAIVDDFLMSCRVLGRGVEETMVAEIARIAERWGARRLQAPFRATERNGPAKGFYAKAGFVAPADPAGDLPRPADAEETVYVLDRAGDGGFPLATPPHVAVERCDTPRGETS